MYDENALRQLEIGPKYQTNTRDNAAIDEFYIPVLSVAKSYDRLSGYFSSASLALAARGIAALIENGGKMRLICSPLLTQDDVEMLNKAWSDNGKIELDEFCSRIFEFDAETIERDHLAAFAWLLKNGRLDIKLAVPTRENGEIIAGALDHEKIGIVKDAFGDVISFSGSNNETINGWLENKEEFKVFKSWVAGQGEYCTLDELDFEKHWNGVQEHVRTVELSDAIRQKLISTSDGFDKEQYVYRHYTRQRGIKQVWQSLNLYDYQNAAICKWWDNRCRLLFRMATGSGKTRTAIGCINRLMEEYANDRFFCVIAVPTTDLCGQWVGELKNRIIADTKFIVANSRNEGWKGELSSEISDIKLGLSLYKAIMVVTTHTTASSDYFCELVNSLNKEVMTILIGDEVHGMGAAIHKKALLENYQKRIGLSATPDRMFDEEGTEMLIEYFGNDDYQFGIKEALKYQRVCPYNYHPILVHLTEDEWCRYQSLTDKIAKLSNAAHHDPEIKDRLEQLLRDRAMIVQAASGKLPRLSKLIADQVDLFKGKALAFTCPQLFKEVQNIFVRNDLAAHSYCEKDGKERPNILKDFTDGRYDVLVAMNCLNEGIDVPDARVEVLVSSSTNPREYIQRLGRVIRKAPGKICAEVFDFLVVPERENSGLIERDFKRAAYIASCAQNSAEAISIMFSKLKEK